VLLTRLTQVRVQVDEAGGGDEAGGVDDLDVRSFDLLVDAGDRAVLDQDVERGVELLRGIDDARVGNEQVHTDECRTQNAERRMKNGHAGAFLNSSFCVLRSAFICSLIR
jgi:hypothetical protein